jgi:hypothetical protein
LEVEEAPIQPVMQLPRRPSVRIVAPLHTYRFPPAFASDPDDDEIAPHVVQLPDDYLPAPPFEDEPDDELVVPVLPALPAPRTRTVSVTSRILLQAYRLPPIYDEDDEDDEDLVDGPIIVIPQLALPEYYHVPAFAIDDDDLELLEPEAESLPPYAPAPAFYDEEAEETDFQVPVFATEPPEPTMAAQPPSPPAVRPTSPPAVRPSSPPAAASRSGRPSLDTIEPLHLRHPVPTASTAASPRPSLAAIEPLRERLTSLEKAAETPATPVKSDPMPIGRVRLPSGSARTPLPKQNADALINNTKVVTPGFFELAKPLRKVGSKPSNDTN